MLTFVCTSAMYVENINKQYLYNSHQVLRCTTSIYPGFLFYQRDPLESDPVNPPEWICMDHINLCGLRFSPLTTKPAGQPAVDKSPLWLSPGWCYTKPAHTHTLRAAASHLFIKNGCSSDPVELYIPLKYVDTETSVKYLDCFDHKLAIIVINNEMHN